MVILNNIYKVNQSVILPIILKLCLILLIFTSNTVKSTPSFPSTYNLHQSTFSKTIIDTNDSSLVKAKQLLFRNKQILSHCIDIKPQLESIEESIRLMEIYNTLQTQEAINNQSKALKKTIKKRSYIAIGAGLISSTFLLLNNNGDNDGFRYGGAALSLSLPIISFISMKKQINAMAPIVEIDYSLLRDHSYPHNQNTLAYFQQTIKLEIFNLKSGISSIASELLAIQELTDTANINLKLRRQLKAFEQTAGDFEGYYQYQYAKIVDMIENQYIIFPFDNGTKVKLGALSKELSEKLEYWHSHQEDFQQNMDDLTLILSPLTQD